MTSKGRGRFLYISTKGSTSEVEPLVEIYSCFRLMNKVIYYVKLLVAVVVAVVVVVVVIIARCVDVV